MSRNIFANKIRSTERELMDLQTARFRPMNELETFTRQFTATVRIKGRPNDEFGEISTRPDLNAVIKIQSDEIALACAAIRTDGIYRRFGIQTRIDSDGNQEFVISCDIGNPDDIQELAGNPANTKEITIAVDITSTYDFTATQYTEQA